MNELLACFKEEGERVIHSKQSCELNNESLIGVWKVYNIEELKKEHNLECSDSGELILKLFQKLGVKKGCELINGVYALAYVTSEGRVRLIRDLLGVKPLWYAEQRGFCFSTEKKLLREEGFTHVLELNPRQILTYDIHESSVEFTNREFFKLGEEYDKTLHELVPKVKRLLVESVEKRVREGEKIGLLFSGGVDSTLLALVLKRLGVDFTCYASGVEGSKDLEWAERAARIHDLRLKKAVFDEEKVEGDLREICSVIESNNAVKVEVVIPFYYAGKKASEDDVSVLFSGLGSEELFAGYQRFEGSEGVNEESLNGLRRLYIRDLYRDYTITNQYGMELELPFLDVDLIQEVLRIPGEYKMNDEYKKVILRKVAMELGVDESVAWRGKKAAQYGSASSKVISKLSKGFSNKSEYLKSVYDGENLKLGVLFSSGKDSNLALHVMKLWNHDVKCLITVLTEEEDSYMFHKPVKELVELQSEAMNTPVVFGRTQGVKEEEVEDLRELIKEAKCEYELNGIVTGALFSNYQKSRVENVCESLGLKTFHPLWRKSQEAELKQLLRQGFHFILTKVAALGLDSSWLNKRVDEGFVKKLLKLRDEHGLNVAGEGGEYETLVLNAPFYDKKLVIQDSEVKESGENRAELIIKKAVLEDE